VRLVANRNDLICAPPRRSAEVPPAWAVVEAILWPAFVVYHLLGHLAS